MSKSVFIPVLTAISYGESIINQPRSPTPPVPIVISSSQSLLLSATPVRCMDTANFINVEVRVCYSCSKHNIFSAKVKESFVWGDPSWKPTTHFFDRLSKSLSFSLRTQTELNLEHGMCTIPQESVLSRSYWVLVRAGSRANAEMHALFSSHRGSFRRLLKVKVQSRPEKERINKLLSFFVV